VKLLLIDNFDSFVFNLAQAFGAMGVDPVVVRNDAALSDLAALEPDAVLVSPGPGSPDEAGVSLEAIGFFAPTTPVFGVCLGHQCIGVAFGGVVDRAPVGPVHGKTSEIEHNDEGVFHGLPQRFVATRYHSLSIRPETLPEDLAVTARSDDGTIMGVRHRSLAVEGVQFHPESILTADGPALLKNFVERAASPA
jgi:anthranilate synthase/aminodeoxychorismate synthase-like glutamine amidotransferase